MPDYLDRNVEKDVDKALKHEKDYISVLLQDSLKRRSRRIAPTLAFCGHGRAGKDLGAEWLGHNYHIDYGGSLSEIVCPLIACALNKPPAECFNTRHNDRDYWYRFCNILRKDDPTLLCKMLLAKADIIVGIRGAIELEACAAEGLVDLSIWVENPRVEKDPTLEYTAHDCDIVVPNAGSKLAYFSKLRRLAESLNLTLRSFE